MCFLKRRVAAFEEHFYLALISIIFLFIFEISFIIAEYSSCSTIRIYYA